MGTAWRLFMNVIRKMSSVSSQPWRVFNSKYFYSGIPSIIQEELAKWLVCTGLQLARSWVPIQLLALRFFFSPNELLTVSLSRWWTVLFVIRENFPEDSSKVSGDLKYRYDLEILIIILTIIEKKVMKILGSSRAVRGRPAKPRLWWYGVRFLV